MHSQPSNLLLEAGVADATPKPEEQIRVNTTASACRPWLEIFMFRIFPNMRLHVTKNTKPITVRAVVTKRKEEGSSYGITIKGVARHPRLPGSVRFTWDTGLWDSSSVRHISSWVGYGEVEYMGRKVRFTLETSKNNVLWVRILDSRGESSPIRFSLERGKMNPRPSTDYD